MKSVVYEDSRLTIKTTMDDDYRAQISRVIASHGGIVLSMVAKRSAWRRLLSLLLSKTFPC